MHSMSKWKKEKYDYKVGQNRGAFLYVSDAKVFIFPVDFEIDTNIQKTRSMSDESTVPDGATCNRLCAEFAEITNTDSACGHFFLQDCNWKLEFALESFFTQCGSVVAAANPSTGGGAQVKEAEVVCKNFSLMSWNVDGLDDKNRASRTKAVIAVIKQEKPLVVFLQEVIEETFNLYKSRLNDEYLLIPSAENLFEYFTVVLLRRSLVKCISHELIPFPSSQMGRSLLKVKAEINAKSFAFYTAHLESTKAYAAERITQLKISFDQIQNEPKSTTVVFGGDLNLRDDELASMEEDLPVGCVDAWEKCGSPKDAKFTWDCLKNDNIQFEQGKKFKPRCRFDRIYVKNSNPATVNLNEFRLVGQERIRSCLCFPSDHWGLCTSFSFV